MTARNPLFDFMPYGAPELLAAQRPNLLRAIVLASGLALTLFMLARALGLSLPPPVSIDVASILPPGTIVDPPPSIHVTEPGSARITAPSRLTPWAPPVPVPDVVAPPLDTGEPDAGARVDGDGDAMAKITPPAGPGAIVEEPLPSRETWVYVDELPVAVKQIEPVYPDLAKSLGIEGHAYVFMLVGKDGRVIRAEVDEKKCDPLFKDAVIGAAMKWVFKPGYVNGHPIPVWVGQSFVFRLH